MEGENHHHGHQRQSEEEAVRAAVAAAGDVVMEERPQALPPVQQEEVTVVVEAAGGADHQFDSFVDPIAVDEAFAHALQMEELAQGEAVWDMVAPRSEELAPAAAVHAAALAGSLPVTPHFPAGPPVFDDDVAGAAEPNLNVVHQVALGGAALRHVPTRLMRGDQQGQDDGMQEAPANYQEAAAQAMLNSFVAKKQQFRAMAANKQQAAPAEAGSNQHAVPVDGPAAAAGGDRPSPSVSVPQPQERGTGRVLSVNYASTRAASAQGMRRRHRQQPVGSGEAITLRLQAQTRAADTQATATPWTVPGAGKEAVISARQALLADAAHHHHSPGFLAGIEEGGEEHGNRWYNSISREAHAMEAMREPRLKLNDDPVHCFQQQFPRFDDHDRPCDLDLDEAAAGPSTTQRTTRPRVLPLADDEVPKFHCGICMETLPVLDLFHGMHCNHRFCVECMAAYIERRINAGEVPIPCPDPACPEAYGEDVAVLHPEVCKKSIDFAAFSSWGDRLTERAIPASLRAYCPNPQCGVLLEATGGKTPAKAYCPVCSHPMCATCGFDWSHDDDDGSSHHDCDEGPNAELVKKLAEERRWKQCPRCKFLVEKISGCDSMLCRCKCVFCYGCGLPERRQTRMEQGAELCRCRQQAAVNADLGHYQIIIFDE